MRHQVGGDAGLQSPNGDPAERDATDAFVVLLSRIVERLNDPTGRPVEVRWLDRGTLLALLAAGDCNVTEIASHAGAEAKVGRDIRRSRDSRMSARALPTSCCMPHGEG
jgi:hypothetical protein